LRDIGAQKKSHEKDLRHAAQLAGNMAHKDEQKNRQYKKRRRVRLEEVGGLLNGFFAKMD
jgi:hypothetical protein